LHHFRLKSMETTFRTKRSKIDPFGGRLWEYLLQRARFGGFSAYAPEKLKPNGKTAVKKKKKKPNIQLALASYVSVNCVIFGYDSKELKVLLLESPVTNGRKSGGKVNSEISLPGDLVQRHENLDDSARRISRGFTGMEHIFLEQLVTHGFPDNKMKPAGARWLPEDIEQRNAHVINIAYFAIINLDEYRQQTGMGESGLKWHSLNKIPKLALNHKQVLQKALETLRFKLKHFPLVFELLPEKFTLWQVQTLYEAISGKKFDKRNFRKKLADQKFLVQLKEKETNVSHKPAFYYKFNYEAYLRQRTDISADSLF
jgi:8-oxo-dGTP diphosphatase